MSKLLYEKRDRIAWLTLNRPDAKNASADEEETLGLLQRIYERTDEGRAK